MKKKFQDWLIVFKNEYSLKMKAVCLSALILFGTAINAHAASPQRGKLNLNAEKTTYKEVFKEIQKQTGFVVMFNNADLDKNETLDVDFYNVELETALKSILIDKDLVYQVKDEFIILEKDESIKQEVQQKQKRIVKGIVTDDKGESLPGVTVILKGTMQGTSTDMDGGFIMEIPDDKKILVFSFIGFATQELNVSDKSNYKVVLVPSDSELDEVVINGFFTQSKNSSTSAVTTIKSEELLQVSNTNILQAISILTPGMAIVENNDMGSNPNYIPEIILRGTNTLATEGEMGLNNPLIIMDGIEISMEQLYDLDIYEIDRVDVLKDASASVVYGAKAANGVIVITRKKVEQKDVRVKYNFVPKYELPDLTYFNLLDARRKLDFERLAGLYDTPNGELDPAYQFKLNNVNRGVNTDWIAKPLRIAYTLNHSVSVTGRGSNMDYGVTAKYTDAKGVMKGDYRKNYGLGFYFSYHLSDKLTIGFRSNFTKTDSKKSPYGRFSDYVEMNPYNPVYDEFGEIIPKYNFDPYSPGDFKEQENPLYNALETSSFSKGESKNMTNNLNLRWDIKKGFYLTARGSMSLSDNKSDDWQSPDAVRYLESTDAQRKGRYDKSAGESINFTGNAVLNYSKTFNEGTVLGVHAGSDISRQRITSSIHAGEGFLKDHLNDIGYAMNYPSGGRPSGFEDLSINVGGFANMNFILKNRYYLDGSIRMSGSSKFGKENRFAPFYAIGAGWNIHNENFLTADWVNTLKLRMSRGTTGSTNFPSNQSTTTYKYDNKYAYLTGIGALPITMGNPDLTWQSTVKYNAGISGRFFNNRLDVKFDYYQSDTKDMLFKVDLPYSVGIDKTKVNLGEMTNSGYDFALSGSLIQTDDIYWRVSISGGHAINKIQKIGEALKRRNEINNKLTSVTPQLLFKEGNSVTAIYAVRSAGIDPATGKELFITKDGDHTFDYNTDDKVVVGNTNPTLMGGISTNFRYKQFSIGTSMSYTFGGDVYNGTIASKVENIDPYHNLDERAYTQRWKAPGDHSRFLGIPEHVSARNTSRFVQRKNELYISNINFSYEFKIKHLKNLGLKKLRIGFGLNDIARISTVKFERGMAYPYSRNYNITISPTF